MENEDEYIVYIQTNGYKFYYKNGKLHREIGPAVLDTIDRNFDSNYSLYISQNLKDKVLYRTTYIPVNPLHNVIGLGDKARSSFDTGITTITRANGSIEKYNDKVEFFSESALFYLEGIQYSKEEFNAILLEKNLKHASETTKKSMIKI